MTKANLDDVYDGKLFTLDDDQYLMLAINLDHGTARLVINNIDDDPDDHHDGQGETLFLGMPEGQFVSVVNVAAIKSAVKSLAAAYQRFRNPRLLFCYSPTRTVVTAEFRSVGAGTLGGWKPEYAPYIEAMYSGFHVEMQ